MFKNTDTKFNAYMLTFLRAQKIVWHKTDIFCGVCEKSGFVLKKVFYDFFVFLHIAQKISFLCETLCAHVECRDVCTDIFFTNFWRFKICFGKRSIWFCFKFRFKHILKGKKTGQKKLTDTSRHSMCSQNSFAKNHNFLCKQSKSSAKKVFLHIPQKMSIFLET